MSKKILISGYYGFENFGDEAILKVLVENLKKTGYSLTVISNNPNHTASKRNVQCVHTFDIVNIIKTIKNTDVLISGGGSLLQDVTSLKSLLYYLFIIFTALFFKKKIIIFAQGIGPINNFFGKFLTQIALKKCTYITVRDIKSLELLNSWQINADLVSDPVWNIKKTNIGNKKNIIGIQLRSWNTLSDVYLNKLATSINSNFSDFDIRIYSLQDCLDYDICKTFQQILLNINPNLNTKLLKAMSVDDTIESFSNLQYLIAMRYHACLLSIKYGIPTIALSYDKKVENIAKEFDLPCSFLQENENIDELINKLKTINQEKLINNSEKHLFDFSKIFEKIGE